FDAQGGGGGVDDPLLGIDNVGITVVASGNPSLSPEIADTHVFGFVFEPQWSWAQGLSISTDWYEVDIKDAISQISQQDVVDRCHLQGIQEQCLNIERDPSTGGITRVFRRFFNQDKALVEGVDVEVAYRAEPNFFDDQLESLSVRLLAGKVLTREDISAGGTVSTQMGQYNFPELTGNITTTYSLGPWSLQLQGRYISGDHLDRDWVEGVDVDYNWVSSSTWWNGTLRYSGEMPDGGDWSVGLNVLNLFDTNPPVIPSGSGDQLVSDQYDVYGRRYNLSFNLSF